MPLDANMLGLTTFDPEDAGALREKIEDVLGGVSTQWWNANKGVVSGHVASLAEAAMQTRAALADGRIGAEQAGILLRNQEAAFRQTLQFTELTTLVLAQKLLDGAFLVIGYAVKNRLGVNLFPHLVA